MESDARPADGGSRRKAASSSVRAPNRCRGTRPPQLVHATVASTRSPTRVASSTRTTTSPRRVGCPMATSQSGDSGYASPTSAPPDARCVAHVSSTALRRASSASLTKWLASRTQSKRRPKRSEPTSTTVSAPCGDAASPRSRRPRRPRSHDGRARSRFVPGQAEIEHARRRRHHARDRLVLSRERQRPVHVDRAPIRRDPAQKSGERYKRARRMPIRS